MSWFRNLRVGTRLLVNAAVTLALLIVVAVVGYTVSSTQQQFAAAAQRAGAVAEAAAQVKFRAADFNGWQTGYAFDIDRGVAGATTDDAAGRKAFLSSAAAFSTELAGLEALHPPAAIAAKVQAARAAFGQYMTVDQHIIALYRSATPEDRAAADKLVAGQEIDLFGQIATAAEGATKLAGDQARAAFATLDEKGRSSRTMILVISVISVGVAITGALLLQATIVPPLRIMSAVLGRIRTGDLTARAGIVSRNEVGEMAAALDASTAATAAIVGHVTDNANQLASASEELSSVSARMSASAEQNSGQAGSVAAAAEQVSRNVQTVSAGAEEMGASIREIATSAGRGGPRRGRRRPAPPSAPTRSSPGWASPPPRSATSSS